MGRPYCSVVVDSVLPTLTETDMLLAKWIEALRSGEYVQGRGSLLTENAGGIRYWCCLGSLCDVSGVGYWEKRGDGLYYYVTPTGAFGAATLPQPVLEAVGLTEELEWGLIWRNDGRGEWEGNPQSFEQIADYLETLLPKQ